MSDSESDFEDIETGVTTVLLGYAGKEALKDDLSLQGNHIGGSPLWLGTSHKPPPDELINCLVCSKPLDLLAQLYCPLPDGDYDRIIYILACCDPNCRRKKGSIRAIKGCDASPQVKQRIRMELEACEPQNVIAPLGDTLFSSSSSFNPFTAPNQPVASPASSQKKKKLRSKKIMQAVKGRYPCKLVEVEEEYLEKDDLPLESLRIEEMETEDEPEPACSEQPPDTKEVEDHTNPTFEHFVKVAENNPQQILRYEFGLKPLLYCQDECAAELANLSGKTLEIQLMPHLISELETVDMLEDGMEWGSIFVACDSFLPELNEHGIGYMEEWVGVQWE